MPSNVSRNVMAFGALHPPQPIRSNGLYLCEIKPRWAGISSRAAIEIASRNALRHNVADRIHFLECDLLTPVLALASETSKPRFDLIVSNPPYVARDEAHTLAREVREHEPHAALFGGEDGVEIYARLVEQAGSLLRLQGILVLELGYNSADRVRAMLAAERHWVNISITSDLAEIPRVLAAERA